MFNTQSKRLTIAVIGDSLLDKYQYGKVERISPEAPVLILDSGFSDPIFKPGGAANVCYQFSHFNSDVYLFSFLDANSYFHFQDLNFNIDYCPIMEVWEGKIPRKIRFFDEDVYLLRQDREMPNYGLKNVEVYREKLISSFYKFSENNKIDVVLMSNYGKGVFDEKLCKSIIKRCNDLNIKIICDPKKNLEHWESCTVIKPNKKEATLLTECKDEISQLDYIYKLTKPDNNGCLITKSGDGVIGKDQEGYFEIKPNVKVKDVSSVIGAGDAFLGILALAIGHGYSLRESAKIAFEGGCLYVKEKHNRPITSYELNRKIDYSAAKNISLEELKYLRFQCYPEEKWVITNGCYDIIHPGHLSTLNFAKSKGHRLIVALNSDESVKRIKGDSRPVVNLEGRIKVVSSLECVDFVVSFEEDTPYNIIKELEPDVLVKGGQYSGGHIVGDDIVKEIHFAPMEQGKSTTNLIEKILNSNK